MSLYIIFFTKFLNTHVHVESTVHNAIGLMLLQIEQIQKGLKLEAQAGLQLADQMRHIFIAQRRIADLLSSCSPDNSTGFCLFYLIFFMVYHFFEVGLTLALL